MMSDNELQPTYDEVVNALDAVINDNEAKDKQIKSLQTQLAIARKAVKSKGKLTEEALLIKGRNIAAAETNQAINQMGRLTAEHVDNMGKYGFGLAQVTQLCLFTDLALLFGLGKSRSKLADMVQPDLEKLTSDTWRKRFQQFKEAENIPGDIESRLAALAAAKQGKVRSVKTYLKSIEAERGPLWAEMVQTAKESQPGSDELHTEMDDAILNHSSDKDHVWLSAAKKIDRYVEYLEQNPQEGELQWRRYLIDSENAAQNRENTIRRLNRNL